jgi:hypothetical protein
MIIPATFLSNYVLQNYGLKVGVRIGFSLLLLGSFFRLFVNDSYNYLVFG